MPKEIEKKEINKKVKTKEIKKPKEEVKTKETKETKKEVKKKVKKVEKKKEINRYYESQGRRKTSVARVRIWSSKDNDEFLINKKPLNKYFPNFVLQEVAKASLKKMGLESNFKVSVIVKGGGLFSQAEAIRHGIARSLVDFNSEFRKKLKKAGYLTRDSRMRERKKFGLKRARKSPRWSKR